MKYEVGQTVQAASVSVEADKTKPPSRFTDGSLVEAMTEIHKRVSDEATRKVLSSTGGLGTERTRSAIIEGLVTRKFLEFRKERSRTVIISTQAGRDLIDVVMPELRDPVTTAKWEAALSMIESGQATAGQFMVRQEGFIKQMVSTILGSEIHVSGGKEFKGGGAVKIDPLPGHGSACPKCGRPMVTRVAKKTREQEERAGDQRFLACTGYPECNYVHRDKKEAK